MLKRILLAACLASAAPGLAQNVETNIVSGPAGGTDAAIGEDLVNLAAECGLEIAAPVTSGDVESFLAVRDRPVTQMGFVQGDVLEYFQTFRTDDPEIRRAIQGIRIAMPLHLSEVHILSRKDLVSLADLDGARVAVGAPGSGTAVTASLVLDLAGLVPAERLALAPDAALTALDEGRADAVILVEGAPSPRINAQSVDPDRFHLVPVEGPVLNAVYEAGRIEAEDYPFLDDGAATIAVRTSLVAYDFDPAQNAYHGASCDMISNMTHLIVTRLDGLRTRGHPEWAEINPAAIPEGWLVSDCALRGVTPGFAFLCRAPDGTVGPSETVEPLPDGPNALFRQRICDRIGC